MHMTIIQTKIQKKKGKKEIRYVPKSLLFFMVNFFITGKTFNLHNNYFSFYVVQITS